LNAAAANRALAASVLAVLHAAGVRTLCLCPGGRNAPLVLAAEAARPAFNVVSFFDERGAAFFALGRIRRDNAPVAVVTTSGTAAAGLLPAMLEAQLSGLNLIAVTADRPRRLRGTGAPQTIDQPPLFAASGAPVFDLEAPDECPPLPRVRGPVHLNVCFDEPLVDGPVGPFSPPPGSTPVRPEEWLSLSRSREACSDFFSRARNPLVLVSSLDPNDAEALAPWLASLPCPLYLEAVSQLRGHPALQDRALFSGERILGSTEAHETCDGILRIGGVPTPRFWRDCSNDQRPILHVANVPFPGMDRPGLVIPLSYFTAVTPDLACPGGDNHALLARDRSLAPQLEKLLDSHPRSEAALVRHLARHLPADARIFLGNSLPIREWDLAAPRLPEDRAIFANRGVNGIDGLVSTALGLSGAGRPMAAVLGDLSALCDLAGLWPAAQLGPESITIAVINNGGGRIFERMFQQDAFLNAHQLGLRGWADIFGWQHAVVTTQEDLWPDAPLRIIEVVPDAEATARFSDAYASLWR
jgi:2-succinyl-5-enolpyruvyl-6-hydroxy-3-cyclohexene-1-carboxylate synthase